MKNFYRTKDIYLPWLQSDGHRLWLSLGSKILSFRKTKNGLLKEDRSCIGHSGDVTRFVYQNDRLYSVSRDKCIACFNATTSELLWKETSHKSDILCIATTKDTICTGSEDGKLKIWDNKKLERKVQFNLNDRVLSCSFVDDQVICGTSYLNYAHSPLTIWNVEKEVLLGFLGTNYKRAAGILSIKNYDQHSIITGGYDTYVRFWDTRLVWNKPVLEFADPYDNFIYCLQTDNENAIVVGLSTHATLCLWDKRYVKRPIRHYFTVKRKTPVFSLELDYRYTYVAIDRGLYLMDFD